MLTIRIGIVSHNARVVGGMETYLATIVPALKRRGAEVACLFESSEGQTDPVVPEDGGVASWIVARDGSAAMESLRRWAPDVLFVHGLRSLSLEREILTVAPAVFFAHAYYGTCISGWKTHAAPVASACSRRFGWGCMAQFYPRRCGGLNPLTMVQQYRLQAERLELLARYERIVVASRHMETEYTRHGLGQRVRIISLPAAAPVSDGRRETDESRRHVLFLGRLEWTKGPDIVLEAAALASSVLPVPVVLTIAGQGPMRESLEAKARRLAGSHPNLTVAIAEWLNARERDSALRAADLLTMPSRWPEPFGLTGVEAASLGVPALAFDTGGIRDWLRHGETGLLVDPSFPAVRRFADAMVRCLGDLPALRRMGEQARTHAAAFTADAHVERLEPVLAEVAATRSSFRAVPA